MRRLTAELARDPIPHLIALALAVAVLFQVLPPAPSPEPEPEPEPDPQPILVRIDTEPVDVQAFPGDGPALLRRIRDRSGGSRGTDGTDP